MEFKTAFEANQEVQKFGHNALLLFAMMLKFQEIDPDDLAAECLTDGRDDKKIDFIRFDSGSGSITLVQGYCSQDWNRQSAPSNKAADLNTAISWLLSGNIDEIPTNLKSKAIAIRDALNDRSIESFEIIYVHNLQASENVKKELETCARTAKRIFESFSCSPEVKFAEIDAKQINEWYLAHERVIVVTDQITLPIDNYLKEQGKGWEAVVATTNLINVSALYEKYGDNLFSANVRGFLGTRKTTKNINRQITLTAENDPENFMIFNNGITAITNALKVQKKSLKLTGIAIINGAQTTGSLHDARIDASRNAKVIIRIILTTQSDLINNIVKYNNTQNVVYTWELRSGDRFQKRLHDEFESLGIKYLNRRSYKRAVGDVISVPASAQALMAFHGRPLIALKGKTEIFDSDTNYSTIFNDYTTARHICFVYSMILAYDDLKNQLSSKPQVELIDTEKRNLEYMSLFSYKQFLVFCVGYSLENILGRKLSNKLSLHFIDSNRNLRALASYWSNIVSVIVDGISSSVSNTTELNSALKSDDRMIKLADSVRSFVSSIRNYASEKFDTFNAKVST